MTQTRIYRLTVHIADVKDVKGEPIEVPYRIEAKSFISAMLQAVKHVMEDGDSLEQFGTIIAVTVETGNRS